MKYQDKLEIGCNEIADHTSENKSACWSH